MGAFPYVAYVEMCSLRWNIYYFRNLIVSTVHCHKNLWVGLSKFKCFVNMCYLNLHKCMNWLKTNSLSPKIALLMLVYTCFLFNFSIKLLIRLGLTPLWLINMSLIASSLNLILFMSYSIDRAKKKGEITNTCSSKCLPQRLVGQVCFQCTYFMFRSWSRKGALFFGNKLIIHPLAYPFAK